MFWAQTVLSFCIWIGVGVALARRTNPASKVVENWSRVVRVLAAASLMLAGLILLFGPITWINAEGYFTPGPMAPMIWLAVTIAGVFFVGLNTMGTGILAALARESAVTETGAATSSNQDLEQ